MSELWIRRDGVVGHWLRWHLLMASVVTLSFYVVHAVYVYIQKLITWLPHVVTQPLDARFLVLTIPLGILWGDVLYERDREANSPKKGTVAEP